MKNVERDWMNAVAALGCVACRNSGLGPTPCQVHHIRTGQGMGQRASNFLVLPLCEAHHTGPNGLHGQRRMFAIMHGSELDLLAQTIEEVLEYQRLAA